MRYGVSLFGLSPLFFKSPELCLTRLRAANYRYLEPCLSLEEIPGLRDRIWLPRDLEQHFLLMQKLGFSIHSLHVFPRDVKKELPEFISLAKQYGISHLVFPFPRTEDPEEVFRSADTYRQISEVLSAENIALLIHNNGPESKVLEDGRCLFEVFLDRCGSGVQAQADVGWLCWGGTDPEAFLWRNRHRIASVHYKDMAEKDGSLAEVSIGTGLVDITAVYQFARAMELIQYADQDSSDGDFLEDTCRVGMLLNSIRDCRDRSRSILCTLDTRDMTVTELAVFPGVIEAPNWMHTDPDCLIYNRDGLIYRYRISTGESTLIPTGHCSNCNNDHVLHPRETHIAVSHSEESWMSQVYILPIDGGEPRLITPNAPSFLHGWSPDGKELAYCAFRDHGKGYEVDIFAISAEGGQEWQLTRDAGFNDGPEYSPDGKHIWFISTRTGLMQCWRMDRDGSNQTQMTFCHRNNWFPHISPDGKQVVYLSYSRDGLDPNEHLPNMDVQLRLMNYDGSGDREILSFFGGQGSINVNSWHKDSQKFAFVKYELEHK